MSVFTALALEEVAGGQGIVGIEQDLAQTGQVRGAGDLGQDGGTPVDFRLPRDPTGEAQAEQSLAYQRGPDAHQPPMVKEREPRAGAGSARGGVDLARPPDEGVSRHAV